MSGPANFLLTKWYFDCVTAEHRAAIAYCISLRWRRVTLRWAGVSVCEPGCGPRHRATLRAGPGAEMHEGVVSLLTPVCRAELTATRPRFEVQLFDSTSGGANWRCVAPAAVASMRPTGESPLHGIGYAECLTMTIPPWRLPISELRWGRWSDATGTHSMVWIDWRGALPRSWVFVDGQQVAAATVGDRSVCAGNASLSLSSTRVLLDRDLGEVLTPITRLRAVVPASLNAFHESKWLSDGVLTTPTAPPRTGQSIHEVVRFA